MKLVEIWNAFMGFTEDKYEVELKSTISYSKDFQKKMTILIYLS